MNKVLAGKRQRKIHPSAAKNNNSKNRCSFLYPFWIFVFSFCHSWCSYARNEFVSPIVYLEYMCKIPCTIVIEYGTTPRTCLVLKHIH